MDGSFSFCFGSCQNTVLYKFAFHDISDSGGCVMGLTRLPSGGMPRPAADQCDAPVQETNDDAFVSKLAASRAGYFSDRYLWAMAGELLRGVGGGRLRRPPVINRGTAARVFIKERIVRAFLNALGKVQVVSLGAGFDSLAFSLMGEGGLHFVEVDFGEVVEHKGECVVASDVLRGVFESVERVEGGIEAVGLGGAKYSLRTCDLRDTVRLRRVVECVGLERECPTLIIAEIVLVYLQPQLADMVIRECGEWFRAVKMFMNMEHVMPDDAFGREMVKNIAQRGSPLLGIERYPSIASQMDRFRRLGWECVEGMSMLQAFLGCVSGEERLRMNRVELLDEVEEWELIMTHYCVLIAAGGEGGSQALSGLMSAAFPLITR